MKALINYITEKLHLNKDIKINTEFVKGDKIFCVSIESFFKKYNIKIYEPFTFLSLKNNELTYNTKYPEDMKDGKNITRTVFLNSNGYYEMKRNSTTALIMSQTAGIDFLEDLLHSNITVDFLLKYFDEEDEYFNDYPLSYDAISDRRIKNLIDIYSDNNVTEKLHLNNDIKIDPAIEDTIDDYLSKKGFELNEDYTITMFDETMLEVKFEPNLVDKWQLRILCTGVVEELRYKVNIKSATGIYDVDERTFRVSLK